MNINDGTIYAAQVCAHFNDIFDVVDFSDSFDGRICFDLLGFVDSEFDFVTCVCVPNAGSIHKTCVALRSKVEDVDLSGLVGSCTVQIGVLELSVQDSGGKISHQNGSSTCANTKGLVG